MNLPDIKSIVHIDPAAVGRLLNAYVSSGSKRTGVSLDDIKTSIMTLPKDDDKPDATFLLMNGMRLFDVIVYLSADEKIRPPLKVDKEIVEASIPPLSKIAESLFFVYFFLITQAKYPVTDAEGNQPKVPKFLTSIMNLKAPASHYCGALASFNIVRFDPRWIKTVEFLDLGVETMNRFGLGVAGYRMFAPFKLLPFKDTIADDIKKSAHFVRGIATSKPDWAIHPITRDPQFLNVYGNFNKNLANLMLETFSEGDLKKLVETKTLFAAPQSDPNFMNYKTWGALQFVPLNDPIFREK
jgi:hypothetical protein